MAENNTVLLRVQLDEGKTQQQLERLVLDIEATRKASQALTAERKAGTVADDEFAKRSVDLQTQLKGQTKEQQALTKNLELYKGAQNGVAGSYDQAQAQLTLAQRQYRGLADSLGDTTEQTQALSAVVRDLRGQLKATDASSLDQFFRSIGDYPKPESLEPLIQQIVRLEELQKAGILTAKELADTDRVAAGFRQQYAQAAAAQGKTLEQATNELQAYGAAVRPTVADLVRLEVEQNKVAASTGKESAAYAEIGFKIGAARKELAGIAPATELAATSSEKAIKKLGEIGGTIEELDNKTGAFGGTVGELKGKFDQAKAGVEAAKVGFTGLRGAIAATGIGLFLLALGALYSYLTRTQEGLDFVERKTKAVSIVVGVLTDKASAVGKVLFEAFDHPLDSLKELAEFIGNNLLNRLTSVGVVLQGIINLDPRRITDGFIQAGTGIADATSKGQNLVAELNNAAKAGEAIAAENQRIRDTERAINVERAQSKKDIEALKLIAEDVTKSTAERAAATQRAAELEQRSINGQLQAQRDRIANMEREAKLTNQLTENNDKLAEERIKLAELEEGSLTRQIELNNKLNELRQAGLEKSLADQKAYYERLAVEAEKGSAAELRAKVKALESDRVAQLAAVGLTENQRKLIVANSEQAIKALRREFTLAAFTQQAILDQQAIDRKLLLVQAGTEEELALQRQKLAVQRDVELAAANLTLRQKQAIEDKFNDDALKLKQESARRRALASYDAQLSTVNAELLAVRKGTTEETELKIEAINTVLAKELAALDKRQDNTARAAQLRANAEKTVQDTRYAAAQAATEQYLQGERNTLDDHHASGLLGEKEYSRAVLASDTQAAAMRLQLAKTYGQETTALQQQLADKQRAIQQELTNDEKAKYLERATAAQGFGQQVGQLIADSLFEQGATIQEFLGKILILVVDTVEQQLLAQQTASIASAAIQSMSQPDSVATFGATGFARIAVLSAAITAFFELFKAGIGAVTTPPKQFALGGVAYVGGGIAQGPSHAQGGIDLYYQGRPAGINIEGMEPILTAGVTRNPLLLSLASSVNQLAGGRALVPNFPVPRMAMGGVAQPLVLSELKGQAGQSIDYNQLAQAVSKLNVKATIVDISAGLERKEFTDKLGNG